MTHSVESRFIALISGALLVVVAPLFTLFLTLSSQQASQSLTEHVDVVLTSNSQALGKPLWDLDADSIEQVALMLVADPMIHAVDIRDTTGKLSVFEGDSNPNNFYGFDARTRPVIYKSVQGVREVGTLTVWVPQPSWFSALHQIEFAFISIFIIAILTVFGAAVFGNRMMVIKPLMRLTAAIEATRRLGSRHHVDWRSNDEMGRLAKSYNEMQALLEREERELKRAHEQSVEIYNLTPAMLFSLTTSDTIAAVSDYWLLASGYCREEVIGRPFSELLCPMDRPAFEGRRPGGDGENSRREITVRFLRSDGSAMDVLIAEAELAGVSGHLTGSLSVMTDVTQLKQSELRNHQQAISDHLTGLLNRQGFESALDLRIVDADREGSRLACLFVDLDRFKSINDNHGHAAGDTVLCEFVARLQPMLDDGDRASRLGGDEFAILLAGHDAEARSEALCQRIVDMLETPFHLDGATVRLSASVGVAFYPQHAASAAELLQKSDLAMYARKRDGKNGTQVYNAAILDRTRERAEIESDIELGIAGNWFEAHFQPIVEITSGRTMGFEALMRMRHPRKGLMPPGPLVSVAEETSSIIEIGNLILEDALANLARASRLPALADAYVAVNFSPLQFQPGLPNRLASLLARHGIRPSRLVVEITEAVLMHDDPEIRRILDEIHSFGCRIALDDFGTGYSSLSYLNRFPVDIVKIDQSFVQSLIGCEPDVERKSRMLIEGITTISHKMNCAVVAEGVETRQQQLQLMQMAVDCAQGYYFAKPQSINDLLANLSSRADEASLAS
ncbi:EAL domain-containing protein [Aliirhizobium terrae]|uniref:putative bifunctional diguanylate cyclase/phosphodiesterase n=1 Tax=Terrirhizobium terrae TaxID=2926709 RepID=UPI002578C1D8|nr:EAL domain-containing protein [Rhizobium sp. CC-CFT758]WJH40400.1 EAL domain-containing protein [Rhizobium sp. CC-CFT758]